MRILTAHTAEIDDTAAAVQDILDQLNLPENLAKNALGLVSCYSEFIETGIVQALCEKLPFDVIGTTTIGTAAPGALGQMLLTLSVLTSDDVQFATGVSASLSGDDLNGPIQAAYDQAAATLPGKPALMLSFVGLLQHFGGDDVIAAINSATGNLPVFGTATVDHTRDYSTAFVIHNGTHQPDTLAFALLSGNVSPTFFVRALSPEKTYKQDAIITASDRNVLKEVNGKTVLAFLQSIGLCKDGNIDGINAIPFLIDHGDGTQPIARAMFAMTPEEHVVCGGSMPVGASLSIGAMDADDIIASANALLTAVAQKAQAGSQGLLLFSCIGRNIALGFDSDKEMQTVDSALGGRMPYQFTYSGGEYCPVYDEQGSPVNRFHNDTLIACLL